MEFKFGDQYLEEIFYNPNATIGHGLSVDKGFRKVVGKIQAAIDERDLRALKGLHYHKLEGNRSHQYALNINDQWRLVVERVERGDHTSLLIISVEDYHK